MIQRHVAELTYGDISAIRLPIDIAFTDQSDTDEVLAILGAELRGEGDVTGGLRRQRERSVGIIFQAHAGVDEKV